MSDLLNGPVIAGPRYSTHLNPPGTTVDFGPPEELDDVPGSRIPTEPLFDSPQGKAVSRRRMRLIMAWELFCSKHSGSMLHSSNTDGLRSWCWEQADKFFADSDRPPTPTARRHLRPPNPPP